MRLTLNMSKIEAKGVSTHLSIKCCFVDRKARVNSLYSIFNYAAKIFLVRIFSSKVEKYS